MKDHEIALFVNELTAIIQESGQSAKLRRRVSDAVHKALSQTGVPVGTDDQERLLFAAHMEAQGFGREAVMPPVPPMKHYRSSHVQVCWEAWAGCLKAHGLSENKREGEVLSEGKV